MTDRRQYKPDLSGERNGRAILTAAHVAEIRRLYATGKWSQRGIGDQFGIKQVTVSAIVRGQTWRDEACTR